MSTPAEVARRYFEACNAHSPEGMAALWRPGGVEWYPPLGAGFEAPDALVEHLSSWFEAAPDLTWEVASITSDDERAIVHSTMRGSWQGRFQGLAGRGMPFTVMTVDIIEVSDGLITHNDCVFDQLTVIRELGLFPAPGSRGEQALKSAGNALTRVRGWLPPRK